MPCKQVIFIYCCHKLRRVRLCEETGSQLQTVSSLVDAVDSHKHTSLQLGIAHHKILDSNRLDRSPGILSLVKGSAAQKSVRSNSLYRPIRAMASECRKDRRNCLLAPWCPLSFARPFLVWRGIHHARSAGEHYNTRINIVAWTKRNDSFTTFGRCIPTQYALEGTAPRGFGVTA
jgi:hypothetical protein